MSESSDYADPEETDAMKASMIPTDNMLPSTVAMKAASDHTQQAFSWHFFAFRGNDCAKANLCH